MIRSWRGARWWLVGLAVAVCIGVAFAAQDAAWRLIEARAFQWDRLLRRQLLYWGMWGVLVPVLWIATERLPLEPSLPRPVFWRRLGGWIGLGIVVSLLHTAVTMSVSHYLGWLAPPPPPAQPRLLFGIWVAFIGDLAGNLLYFMLIGTAFHAARYQRRGAELATRLATAELEMLRMQQHPHFFFNTLNTVSALVERDPEAARGVLARLGDLLRISLEGVSQRVPLQQELATLQLYLDIQGARFGERLKVAIDVEPAAQSVPVPTLVLQPFVENSIRHALEPRRNPLMIRIRARVHGDRLTLIVADDGSGASTSTRGRGLGLANTRARLAKLYPENHRFEAGNDLQGGFTVLMDLPVQ